MMAQYGACLQERQDGFFGIHVLTAADAAVVDGACKGDGGRHWEPYY